MKTTDNFKIVGGVLTFVGEEPDNFEDGMLLSIEKWIMVAANAGIWCGGGHTCGLCMVAGGVTCGDCPIKRYGYDGCRGTPYASYHISHDKKSAMKELKFLFEVQRAMEDGLL